MASATFPLHARSSWESMRSDRVPEAKRVLATQEIEVRVSSGVIFITTSRPVQVKVFNILGQPVSHESIPAGTFRLQLGAHGIFIVKIGEITCKVVL